MKLLAASKLHPKLNSCVYCIAMSGHSLPHNCPPCGNMLYSCPSSITAIKLLFICDKIDENRNINIVAHQYCYIQKCVIGIMSVKTRSYLDMTWTWVECNKIWHSFDDWLIFENWHPAHPYPPTLYSSFNTGVTGRILTTSQNYIFNRIEERRHCVIDVIGSSLIEDFNIHLLICAVLLMWQ